MAVPVSGMNKIEMKEKTAKHTTIQNHILFLGARALPTLSFVVVLTCFLNFFRPFSWCLSAIDFNLTLFQVFEQPTSLLISERT